MSILIWLMGVIHIPISRIRDLRALLQKGALPTYALPDSHIQIPPKEVARDCGRYGRVVVSTDLLEDILHLPGGTQIHRSLPEHTFGCGQITLLLSSPDFPRVAEGDPIPIYEPLFRGEIRDDIEFIRWS